MKNTLRYALLSGLLVVAPLSAFAQDAPVAEAPAPTMDAVPAEAAPAPEAAVAAEVVAEPAPVAEAVPATPAAQRAIATTADGQITAPPEGKGQVVFYRPSKFIGAALSYSVREGGAPIAKIGNGKYYVVVADPGAHAYQMKGEVTDTLNMEIDAGESYFVEAGIGMGIIAGRPNLTPSTLENFEVFAGKLKMGKPAKN